MTDRIEGREALLKLHQAVFGQQPPEGLSDEQVETRITCQLEADLRAAVRGFCEAGAGLDSVCTLIASTVLSLPRIAVLAAAHDLVGQAIGTAAAMAAAESATPKDRFKIHRKGDDEPPASEFDA